MKYLVTLEFLYRTSVEVEADSPAEASKKANDLQLDDIFDSETIPVTSLEDGQPISAEPV